MHKDRIPLSQPQGVNQVSMDGLRCLVVVSFQQLEEREHYYSFYFLSLPREHWHSSEMAEWMQQLKMVPQKNCESSDSFSHLGMGRKDAVQLHFTK